MSPNERHLHRTWELVPLHSLSPRGQNAERTLGNLSETDGTGTQGWGCPGDEASRVPTAFSAELWHPQLLELHHWPPLTFASSILRRTPWGFHFSVLRGPWPIMPGTLSGWQGCHVHALERRGTFSASWGMTVMRGMIRARSITEMLVTWSWNRKHKFTRLRVCNLMLSTV